VLLLLLLMMMMMMPEVMLKLITWRSTSTRASQPLNRIDGPSQRDTATQTDRQTDRRVDTLPASKHVDSACHCQQACYRRPRKDRSLCLAS